MPILPIDLQVQFAQMGNLGKLVSQGEIAVHNQAMLSGEHVANMSQVVDNTVTQTDQTPQEGNTISGDGDSGQPYQGKGQNDEKDKEEEKNKKNVNFEPDLGNIIDIRE